LATDAPPDELVLVEAPALVEVDALAPVEVEALVLAAGAALEVELLLLLLPQPARNAPETTAIATSDRSL
jgi:hypothetical protein